ncbi:uncharacterized protein LOC121861074 [Homarus americanus]|nr:uncharacterized protein LOC121861074 [Homarus americanus]XP_042214552.1 uncharacterized protein LOC121861074 [Homarus americanus]
MWCGRVLAALWAAWVVQAEPEGRGLTWAAVMGAPPERTPYLEPRPFMENDNTAYYDDSSDQFFDNPDYVYVDTEDASYKEPLAPVSEKEGDSSQVAERRTFDVLWHAFMDQNTPQQELGDRPARETATRRPTLIEAVFKTIDDHIVKDLEQWTTYSSQSTTTPPPPRIPTATAIQQASPDNDELLLVTDEQGRQHIVSVNDIVNSLGHLDEKTLTDLILPPDEGAASVRSTRRTLPPLPPSILPETNPALPQGVPLLLGTTASDNAAVERPQRHTGPTKTTTDNEEVYVVQDENGELQLITLNDILASLGQLDSNSVNELLFSQTGGATIPSRAEPSPPLSSPPDATTTSTASKSLASISNLNKNGPTRANPFTFPNVASSISVGDQRGSAVPRKQVTKSAHPSTHSGPQRTDGMIVHTDEDGNIHITPDPSQPLNIQNIIAVAEQTANQAASEPRPTIRTNILPQHNEKVQNTHRGQQIMSFLTGERNAKLPTTTQPIVSQTVAPTQHHRGINSFHQSLLQALQQQPSNNPIVNPLAQYRTSSSIPQPLVQSVANPVVQPATQTSEGGFGATISSMLSRLIGYPEEQQQVVQQPQLAPNPSDPEFVNLVVQQQARQGPNDLFGSVTIPLPKPIHYQHTQPAQFAVTSQNPNQASSRVGGEPLPSILYNLSPGVKETLRRQMNDKPQFRFARTQQQTFPQARSRMDTGFVDTLNPQEDLVASATTSPKIYPSKLTSLPPALLKQLIKARLNTLVDNVQVAPSVAPRPTVDHTKPRERSSYAEIPYASNDYGYGGYGHDYSHVEVDKNRKLFDIFLLADMVKVHKRGNDNLSIKAPKIGDASKFVDTHSHRYGYHR